MAIEPRSGTLPSARGSSKSVAALTRAEERELRRGVAAYSFSRLGMPDSEIDDHVQNAWLKLLERPSAVRDLNGALSWATSNSWRMELRRRRRHPAYPLDSLSSRDAREQASPHEQAERREILRDRLAMLAAMPELQRNLVLLRDGHGLQPAAIRAALGLTPRRYRRLRAAAHRGLRQRVSAAPDAAQHTTAARSG